MDKDIPLTDQQIKIIRHTVGLELNPKQKEYYRNRYIITHGLLKFKPELNDLCEKGIMDVVKTERYLFFFLTDLGLQIAQRYNAYKPKEGYVKESR